MVFWSGTIYYTQRTVRMKHLIFILFVLALVYGFRTVLKKHKESQDCYCQAVYYNGVGNVIKRGAKYPSHCNQNGRLHSDGAVYSILECTTKCIEDERHR